MYLVSKNYNGTSMLQKKRFELLASLHQGLEGGPLDPETEVEGQSLYVDTVGGEQLDVRVINEGDAVHIDYPEVGRVGLNLPDVDNFVDVLLSLH